VVPAVSPVSVTECDVTSELLNIDNEPYETVVPYSTCEVDAWSVVQVIVAVLDVMPVALTALITGAGAAVVANVKFPDVTSVPPELVDSTA
jgi:hypothetical protein